MSYQAWIKGESIPSLKWVVNLCKALEQPVHRVCDALGFDMEGIPSELDSKPYSKQNLPSSLEGGDYEALAGLLADLSPEKGAVLLKFLLNKKDDGKRSFDFFSLFEQDDSVGGQMHAFLNITMNNIPLIISKFKILIAKFICIEFFKVCCLIFYKIKCISL